MGERSNSISGLNYKISKEINSNLITCRFMEFFGEIALVNKKNLQIAHQLVNKVMFIENPLWTSVFK